MIQNLISMNGYGLFVWASFSITFLVCALVYLRTYKTLKKYEREFAKEINQLSFEQKRERINIDVILASHAHHVPQVG